MTKKHTQTTLDVSIEYTVIGLDLAKYDVSLAAVTLNEGEIIRIDRVTYAELYELADKLSCVVKCRLSSRPPPLAK